MKGKQSIGALIVALLLGTFSLARADTILFPYAPKNLPNVTTLISVVNKGDAAFLLYSYKVKDTFAAPDANCVRDPATDEKVRTTHADDLVTFDVAGNFGSGNALFGDPDSYGGAFHDSRSGPHRMTLLVSHSNMGGTLVNVGDNMSLYGEAMILDIAFGAGWGYKAINDPNREDDTFTVDTKSSLAPEFTFPAPDLFSSLGGFRTFTFFPPNDWMTRFFVTPLGANLRTQSTKAEVSVVAAAAPLPGPSTYKLFGVFDRGGNLVVSASTSKTVSCIGAIDITGFLDSTANAAIAGEGGWALLYNSGGGADGPAGTDNPVVVYKLDFVVQSGTYGGTVNNAYCLSCEPAQ